MKCNLEWIAQYLDKPIGPDEARQALMNGGLPIESVEPHGDSFVLDVEVTSNRADCLCHIGLARELAALCGRRFIPPSSEKTLDFHGTPHGRARTPDTRGAAADLQVEIAAPDACGLYIGSILENVVVRPSPRWMANRLESLGLRSINNVVDITNYVMFECGQPLHAFDADRVVDRRIVVRGSVGGESIATLDGREHKLPAGTLLIADPQKALAIAGIMGGRDSEVTSATTRIVLESARFDATTVRKAARALGLMTDASHRFERGVDPEMATKAARRAIELLVEHAGATLSAGPIAAGKVGTGPAAITLRGARVQRVLGVCVPPRRMIEILISLGFAVRSEPETTAESPDAATFSCVPPTWRMDVTREIDLIEEIARVFGYGNIPARDRMEHLIQPKDTDQTVLRRVRDTATAAGWNEVVTFSFVDDKDAAMFLVDGARAVVVNDAVRKASNVLRPSLLPSLLRVRRANQNAGDAQSRVFEHAQVYWQEGNSGAPPTERRRCAALGNDVHELRGLLEIIVRRLDRDRAVVATPRAFPWYEPGISATLELAAAGADRGAAIGHLGQLSAEIRKRHDLRAVVCGMEIDVDALMAIYRPAPRAGPLPRFPAAHRDLSLVVAEDVPWRDVQGALDEAKLMHLEAINFVGTYRDKQLGAGKKSLTLALSFRDAAGTLKADQIDVEVRRAVQVMEQTFAASLR